MGECSAADTVCLSHAYHNTLGLIKGPSVQLVFGFEYVVLLTAVVHVFVKYVVHAVDLHRDNPSGGAKGGGQPGHGPRL